METTSVYLELYNYVKLLCLRPYPVPRVHKSMSKKEVERLVILEVLKDANESEREAPSLDQFKAKINPVRF